MLTWSCFILRDEVRRSAFCASSSFSISFFWFLLDVSKSNSNFLSKSYKRKVTLALFGLQNYTVLVYATKLNKRDGYYHPHLAHLLTSRHLKNWWDHAGCKLLREGCLDKSKTDLLSPFFSLSQYVGAIYISLNSRGGVHGLPERAHITRYFAIFKNIPVAPVQNVAPELPTADEFWPWAACLASVPLAEESSSRANWLF